MKISIHRVPPTLVSKTLLVVLCAVTLVVLASGCTAMFQPSQYTPSPTPELEFSCIPDGDPQIAVVTKIVDGDTVWVRMEGDTFKVRYIGVNTPEIGEEGADKATELNSSLVLGKEVLLYRDTSETDKYGRLLRYVIADGLFVNYELVDRGVAEAGTWKPDTACDLFIKYGPEN